MNARSLVFVAAVACLVLALATVSFAESEYENLDGYRITSGSGGDGITLGAVWYISQTPDGFIWLASEAGLVRFDGVRFTTDIVNGAKGLPLAASRAVYVARDGSLWVGYGSGEGVYQIANGDVRQIYLKNAIK